MNKNDIANFAHRATPETLGDFPVQPGDDVIWTSQSGGSTTVKRGRVVYIGRRGDWGDWHGLAANTPEARAPAMAPETRRPPTTNKMKPWTPRAMHSGSNRASGSATHAQTATPPSVRPTSSSSGTMA